MPKPPLGRLALLAIGMTGLASALIDPPQFDYIDQRENVTYQDVETIGTLRDALVDRFIAKTLSAKLHNRVAASGLMTPREGALAHDGVLDYTNFFGPAPLTAHRGLYTEQSEHALAANSQAVGDYMRELARCGVEFVQIVHPPKPAVHALYADRGAYRDSDIGAYVAAADEPVRSHILDLTSFLQVSARERAAPLYYRYGTHHDRLGADLAAVEISRRLTALGLLPRPLEPGRFSAPEETDRTFDGVPWFLAGMVDDDLFPMIWGDAERPQESYPPIPDGLLEGLVINWEEDHLRSLNETALSDRRALIVGDSFSIYLAPYFARMFREMMIFYDTDVIDIDFDAAFAMRQAPDIVIHNRVGRALHSIRKYNPAPATCGAA